MEVHHPHHPTHKKKWTEYLLEFFMLFLAVFLGFIAENIREHAVEKNRAKELTISLIKDLRKDTSSLNFLISFEQVNQMRYDTLLGLLKMPFSQIPQQTFYRLIRKAQYGLEFSPSTATINQLKNAGYLRYFNKDSLALLLSEYEFHLKDAAGETEIVRTLVYNKYYDVIASILDPELLEVQFSGIDTTPEAIGITSIPAADLKRIRNLLVLMRRARGAYIEIYSELKDKATQIIKYLEE